MHSSMEITDQVYSNIKDGEVQRRISGLNKNQGQLSEANLLEELKKPIERLERTAK